MSEYRNEGWSITIDVEKEHYTTTTEVEKALKSARR